MNNENSKLEMPTKSKGMPKLNIAGPSTKVYSYEQQLNMMEAGKKYTKNK
jgi:hypothetical protein